MSSERALRRPRRRRGAEHNVEFLEPRTLLATFLVTNIDNSGAGSLRQAIQDANDAAGADVITFNIGGPGGPFVIQPRAVDPADPLTAPMPITGPVLIDGYTQPTAAPNTLAAGDDARLRIQIDGALAPAGVAGLFASGAGVTIRGLSITGFEDGIILRGGGGSTITGCFIGLDPSGNPAPNRSNGISVEASPVNTIGGTDSADRNLISANRRDGIRLIRTETVDTLIQGNYVGTDRTGTVDIGNGAVGIEVGAFDTSQGYASRTTIGGATAGSRNVISGNGGNGIALVGTAARDNVIQGNYIGTNVTATAAIPNDFHGIVLTLPVSNTGQALSGTSSDNIIGGTVPGAGNVLSGNKRSGLRLVGSANNNLIQGNFIGTNAFGNTAVPNTLDGIQLQDAADVGVAGPQNNTIGGTAVGAGNVISANGRNGIQLVGATTTSNVIQHNRIGIAVNNQALGNTGNGILIDQQASDTTIGYDGSGADPVDTANVIGHNGGAGVAIASGGSNRVSANSIYANGKPGIDLGNDGATANDEGDADTGANGLLNSPLISDAKIDQTGLHVTGKYASAAGVTVRVEFFRNPEQDHLSIDSGKQFLGFRNLTAGADGSVAINTTFTGTQFALGDTVTATATDTQGNTSEFGTGDCDVDLSPLTVTGDFAFNPATAMCEATGTADKPVEIGNATGSVRVRVVGTVTYNQKTLQATGTFSALFGAWQPLFTGSITADVGAPSASARLLVPQPSTLPDGVRPALLPVVFTTVTFGPFDIQLQGSITLPAALAGLSVNVNGANFFVVSPADNQLLISGGTLALPDVKATFFGTLNVEVTGLAATYTGTTRTLKLQGAFKIKGLFESATVEANLAGPDNFISIGPFTDGTPPVEHVGVSAHGTVGLSDIEVAEGVFGLEAISVTLGITNNALTELGGAATVKLPSGKKVSGEIGFKVVDGSWQLDKLALKAEELNYPVGTTGVFFQSIGGSVKDLAVGEPPPTFEGTIGFSYGPEISVSVPPLFGGDGKEKEVSLVGLELTLAVTVDLFDFDVNKLVVTASGALKILGGVAEGTASAELNFPEGVLKLGATFTALGGFMSASANLTGNAQLDFTGSGTAAIKVPKGIPIVGGITLAGGSVYLQYRNDDTFADDYLAGYAEINLFTAVYRFGAKYNFDGTAELLSASPLADVPPSAGAVSAQAGVSRSFSVPADSGPIVLSAAWQNAAATIPAFRVTGPRGVSYTNADSGNGSVEIVPGLSSDTRLTVAVRAPAAGTWTLELPQPEALGAVTIEGAGAAPAPSVAVTAPAGTVSGDAVTLVYQAQDPNAGAAVSLFYDADGAGFDGKQIVGRLAPGAGQYSWNTTGLNPGDYHVYAVVSDTIGAPALAYAPGIVHVAPRVVDRQVFYNNSAFDGRDVAANAADDKAIDTRKRALLPGRRATFENVTGYSSGINGIMIDLAGLPADAAGAITVDDFEFKVGTGGNPGSWTAAPRPSAVLVRPGAGLGGAARVSITWPDRAVRNEWLQVTVKADSHTGLTRPDVFYFGNLVGKTTASPPGRPTALRLSPLDLLAVRRSLASGPTDVANSADLNHDGRVDALDLATARSNLLRVLQPIDSGAALAPA